MFSICGILLWQFQFFFSSISPLQRWPGKERRQEIGTKTKPMRSIWYKERKQERKTNINFKKVVWVSGQLNDFSEKKKQVSVHASQNDHHFFIFTSGRWTSRSILPSSGVTKWQTGFDLFSTSGVWKITQVENRELDFSILEKDICRIWKKQAT